MPPCTRSDPLQLGSSVLQTDCCQTQAQDAAGASSSAAACDPLSSCHPSQQHHNGSSSGSGPGAYVDHHRRQQHASGVDASHRYSDGDHGSTDVIDLCNVIDLCDSGDEDETVSATISCVCCLSTV